ncbi:hypothetical protein ACMG4P_24805 [Pseudovibrio denitrificans]|uniref:hypothetical protein n=1 Tax=Pseudovibrio denitrificans TaxID=258256 RepID=UPI0039BEEBD0
MTSHLSFTEIIREKCNSINWENCAEAYQEARDVLEIVSIPSNLKILLEEFVSNQRLKEKSKIFNLFSKLVLLDGQDYKWKLRLHVFDRQVLEAHHHHASFCACVLQGSYSHFLFGPNSSLDARRLSFPLRPLFIHNHEPGSFYFIDHDMVHATMIEKPTVTLMLQAGSERSSFEIYDLETGNRRIRMTNPDISVTDSQEPGESRMSENELSAIRERLESDGLI